MKRTFHKETCKMKKLQAKTSCSAINKEHKALLRFRAFCLMTIFSLTLTTSNANAAIYYLDAVNGNDTTGNGSSALPWKTLSKVQTTAVGGDTVILRSGDYGEFVDTTTTRTTWLIYKADTGNTPVFSPTTSTYAMWLGRWDGPYNKYLCFQDITFRTSQPLGTNNALAYVGFVNYVKFIDCTFIGAGYTELDRSKGLYIKNSSYIDVNGCIIYGTGQDPEMAFCYGIEGSYSHNINIIDCDITKCQFGIAAFGTNWTITGCEIHHLNDDGIRGQNIADSVIENNHIYNIVAPEGSGAHNDCIQLFTVGGSNVNTNAPDYVYTENITIRGNRLHDSKGQIILWNGFTPQTPGGPGSQNIIVENNLIYGADLAGQGAWAINISDTDNLTFKNNTIIGKTYFGGDINLSILTNNILGGIVDCRFDHGSTINYEDYNILKTWWVSMAGYVQGSHTIQLQNDILIENLFVDAANNDYNLKPTSLAIDYCPLQGSPETDLSGNVREDIPGVGNDGSNYADTGCYEYTTPQPSNSAPVLAEIENKSVGENTTLTFSVTATDTDNDDLTYSAQNLPEGAVFYDQTFTWTPQDQAGNYHDVTFTVTDGQEEDSQAITITVTDSVTQNVVPKAVGLLQSDAELLISSAGLTVGTITHAYSSSISTGRVISQTPPEDTSVEAGSPVALLVSDGFAPLLSENFDDGNFLGWTIIDQGDKQAPSEWSALTGTMIQSRNIYSEPLTTDALDKLGTYAFYNAGSLWTHYLITANIRSTDNDTIGLMFRYQDPNNYYRFSWDSERHYRRLTRRVNGIVTLLAQDNISYVSNQNYLIQILCQADIMQVYIDGNLIFSVADASMASGTIGLYCWGNTGSYFDDIIVDNLEMVNLAPSISSVTATPYIILDDQTCELQVVASDSDSGPFPLSYNWTVQQGQGSITNPTTANPTYTPPDVGNTQTFTLTVHVSDGRDTTTDSVNITVAQDADAVPLLSEDFDDGDLSQWGIVDQGDLQAPSEWSADTGIMIQSRNIFSMPAGNELPKPGTYAYYTNGADWTDYTTTLSITSYDNDDIGLMFRYQDANNYYRFSWDHERRYRRLIKMVNGTASLLAQDYVPYLAGQSYQLQVICQADNIQIYIDGDLIFTVPDSSLDSGSIALYCWGNTGSFFDNIVVENLSTTNIAPTILSTTATPSTINDNQTAKLQVSAYDPDFGPSALSYNWTVLQGQGSIINPTTASPTYYPPDVDDSQTFTLTVNISDGSLTTTDTVNITVNNAAVPLLSENFDDGTHDGWYIIDEGDQDGPSEWSAQTGTMVQSRNIYSLPVGVELPKLGTYALYINGFSWTNYKAKITVGSDDNDAVGLMFRYQNINNYYRFSWDSERRYRRLVKKENGIFSLLDEDYISYVPGQDFQVEIRAQGSYLKIFIDGELIFSGFDNSLSWGTITFYCWGNSGTYFDDITVEPM